MDSKELAEQLGTVSGGQLVVKVGDQYFKVQGVLDNNDMVCLTLGGNFLPQEGGGTPPPAPTEVTPATGTSERDAESNAGNVPVFSSESNVSNSDPDSNG